MLISSAVSYCSLLFNWSLPICLSHGLFMAHESQSSLLERSLASEFYNHNNNFLRANRCISCKEEFILFPTRAFLVVRGKFLLTDFFLTTQFRLSTFESLMPGVQVFENLSLGHITLVMWSEFPSIYLQVMNDVPDVSDDNNSAKQAVRDQLGSFSTVGWKFKDHKARLYLTKFLV